MFCASLYRPAFDHGRSRGRCCCDGTTQLKARRLIERAVFRLGALEAAGADEHVEVGEHGIDALSCRTEHGLKQDQPTVGSDGVADDLKDGDGFLVIPIVDHSGEHVEVASRGNGDKEIAGDGLAAIGNAGPGNGLLPTLEGVGHVKENAMHLRMALENFRENSSVASPDVYELSGEGEVICVEETGCVDLRIRGHHCVEVSEQFRVAL